MRKLLISLTIVLAGALTLAGLGMAQAQEEEPVPQPSKVWLGIQIHDGETGVEVVAVLPESPAEVAGLQAGDLITAINGTETPTAAALIEQIAALQSGDEVTLSITRDDATQDIVATLGEMPEGIAVNVTPAMPFNGDRRGGRGNGDHMFVMGGPSMGVQYHTIDATFAENAGLSASTGALVLAIVPDSAASKAGLQAGDVITAVDGIAVDEEHNLTNLVDDYEVGDVLSLTIQRAGAEQTIEVTLEEQAMPYFEVAPFGQAGRGGRNDRGEFGFEFGGSTIPAVPFNFEFGGNLPNLGGLLDQFKDSIPTDGSPFTVICTDEDGNTVFSLSLSGALDGEPLAFTAPNSDAQGLDLDSLSCELKLDEEAVPVPSGEGL